MQYEYSKANLLLFDRYPSHWQLIRCRNLLKEKNEQVGARMDFQLLSLTKKGVIFRDTQNGKGKFPKDFESYKVVGPKELIFCLFDIDETPRTVGLSSICGMITGAYDVFTVNQSLSYPDFLYYYFIAVDDIKALKPLYSGLRKVVQMSKFLGAQIPIPPLEEQEKIVEYLSTKTLQIDAQQRERERELRLLEELKQAEIANVVTRGLNPDVPMKDSGIPWIGQIPAHWEVMRMKRIFTESTEKIENEGGLLLSLSQYTGILPKSEVAKTGMFEAESTIGYNIVHPGQFVMNIMLAWNGSYAISDYEGVISPAYSVFNFNIECEKKYFHYLLRLQSYAGAFKTQSRGIIESRLRLYPNQFYQFPCIVPPIEEQKSIVKYIETKEKIIDETIANLRAEIDFLTEYKQRLIADVVTGQIKVD